MCGEVPACMGAVTISPRSSQCFRAQGPYTPLRGAAVFLTTMKPLTLAERSDWTRIKTKVAALHVRFRDAAETLLEMGRMMEEAAERKLYRADGLTFEDAARKVWGFSASYSHRLRRAAKYFDAQKLLSDCGQSEEPTAAGALKVINSPKPKSELTQPPDKTINLPTVKVMSAKLDRTQPIEMKVPPPLPVDAQELTAKVSELWKVAELLFRESAFAADGRFRRLHTVAQELFSATQGMLPLGSELPKNKPKLKARADQGQIVWYCKARGLPASDGDWFYDKMLQSGWKYGSQDVKDWQACIRNWERLRVFPSQKMAAARANGQAPPESMVMKQTRKLFKEIDGMNLGDK